MKAREGRIPPSARPWLAEAAEGVVRLYEAWGRPEQAAAWRARLRMTAGDMPRDVFERP